MIAQVGFNRGLEVVTISVVVVLPSKRYLYLVIGLVKKVMKTFYITNQFKSRQDYNCKKIKEDSLVENLNMDQFKKLFKI
jgi:hypothetical protein